VGHRLANPKTRAWAEIDLGAIAHNVRLTQGAVGTGVAVLAVVKADGYGHGAVESARASLEGGATALGVATVDEAFELRDAGINAPILLLGASLPGAAPDIVAEGIEPFLYDLESALALYRAGSRLGKPARVHVKLDCGMGRLGILPGEVVPFMETVAESPAFQVAGIATQLPSPEANREETLRQFAAFDSALQACRAIVSRQTARPIAHCANSSTCLLYPESRYDMVRVGLLVYGIDPLEGAEPAVAVAAGARAQAEAAAGTSVTRVSTPVAVADNDTPGSIQAQLRPAMTLRARLVSKKRLPAGSKISYGGTYTLPQDADVGVVAMGYGDGFSRHMSNRGQVLLRGKRAPVIGVVCMDLFMVDLTGVPDAKVGDAATIIGRDGSQEITANEIAALTGVPVHTVISSIGARIPRVFVPDPGQSDSR
jgi:alanine racemase